jgi:hypothetical protein
VQGGLKHLIGIVIWRLSNPNFTEEKAKVADKVAKSDSKKKKVRVIKNEKS